MESHFFDKNLVLYAVKANGVIFTDTKNFTHGFGNRDLIRGIKL